MTETLAQCERDVERARAKLTTDLSTLRSPATFTAFSNGLKQEAFEAKDSVVQHAKDAVATGLEGLIDDLKAKAAANPAAALTIGAGVAWQLIRNPPIATALIGAGLFSLWRTQAFGTARDNRDYLDQGKHRLKQQFSELGSEAADVAADVGEVISDKTGQLYDAAKEKVQGWSQDAGETAAAAGSTVKGQTESLANSARRTFHDAVDQAAGVASRATDTATTLARDTVSSVRSTAAGVGDLVPGSRDVLFLGIAGLAVAGALGIAMQKRLAADSN